MFPKNSATPPQIAIGAVVQISDGSVQTSGCGVRILPFGGAEGNGGGTTAYSTDGVILYTPTQAETNYSSFILIAKKTGCIPATVTIVTTSTATPGTVVVTTNNDKSGYSLLATGADLILKSSTFVQAIVAAINEFATYGLTALNTLLVSTGIKASSIPNATLANGAHGGASATITLQTPVAATVASVPDSSGVTEILTRIPDASPGANGGLPTTNGTKLNQTVDLTSGQSITASNMRGTDNAMLATAKPTVGGYDTGQDPATLLLVTPANKLAVDANHLVAVPTTQKVDIIDAPNATALAAIKTKIEESGSTLATLLARIVGTLLTGNHSPQSGDAYAIVNSGTYGNSALATLLATVAGYIDTEIQTILTELAKVPKSDSTVSWNDTALSAIVTKMQALGTHLAAIKAITDKIVFEGATNYVQAQVKAQDNIDFGATQKNSIRDAIVDDATRIDASLLNTLSGHDPGATLVKVADLPAPPSAASIADAVLDESGAGHTGLIATQLDAAISTRTKPSDTQSAVTSVTNPVTIASGQIFTKKNTALNNIEFLMVLAIDGKTAATGKTVVVQRSIDGGAFANAVNTPATEVSDGIYKINAAASDMNGTVITFKCTEASCETRFFTIFTQA
jgi:hypothetical protein